MSLVSSPFSKEEDNHTHDLLWEAPIPTWDSWDLIQVATGWCPVSFEGPPGTPDLQLLPHKAQVTHASHIVPASLLHTCAATQGISKGPKSLFDQLRTQFWGGLALAKGQTPTQPLSHSLHLHKMGGNMMKSFLVEIKPGRSFTNYFHGKNQTPLREN